MLGKIKQSLFCPSLIENQFDSKCFNLILFDIFFLPLFPWFSVSISLPILLFWFSKKGHLTKFEPEHKPFGIIVVLMAISTIFSLIGFEDASYNTDFFTSFKRFVQYITSFCYFFFFMYFFIQNQRKVTNIVFYGIVYITLYAVFYTLYQDAFVQFKQIICPFDPQVDRWLDGNLLAVYRFNYLWADPNNVAYAITSLSLFYIIEERESILKKYIVLGCLLYVLLCTMSIGGIGVAAVLISFVFFFTDRFWSGKSPAIIVLIALIITVGLVSYNFDYLYQMYDSGIRTRQDLYGSDGMSGGGGRWKDLLRGLSEFNPLFLVVGSGQEGFVTEIGHIYVWYMYGLPVYIYFLYVLFRKKARQTFTEYLPIVPMFVGFTVNIAIGEQKYMLLLILISSYYSAKSYRLKNRLLQ